MAGKAEGGFAGDTTLAEEDCPANQSAPPGPLAHGMMRFGARGRGAFVLSVLLLIAVPALSPLRPHRVTPASAPKDHFSAERAMEDLPIIARDPHPADSEAQARVKDHLVKRLSAMGMQPSVQKAPGLENVLARLPGTDPSGAILILSHYDSDPAGPGAGDNGSGVAALLEVMRALKEGPPLRNDVIALFDDGEEAPHPFEGASLFVREHPWVRDVRVAISVDSAVQGPISTNEIGPENGFMVEALARAYSGGAWTSASGGGGYNYTPFREAGIQGLALEDNYPFKEKHSALDLPGVVSAASVQQLGDQTLAITRDLGNSDLADPRGPDQTWFSVSTLGLAHYARTWTLPLAIAAAASWVLAVSLALRRRLASWRGLTVALGTISASIVLAAITVGALMTVVPGLLRWETANWPDWPEVIPPHGGIVAGLLAILVLGLAITGYSLVRRRSTRADYSLAGLALVLVPAIALVSGAPGMVYVFIWSVLVGSAGWIAAGLMGRLQWTWLVGMAATVAAFPLIILLLPFLPGVVMSDGMKSLAILAGVLALLLGVVLPAVDGLFGPPHASSRSSLAAAARAKWEDHV